MKKSLIFPLVYSVIFTGLLFPPYSAAQSDGLASRWSFDEADGSVARDSVRGTDDKITGLFERVDGITGKGLRFDEETTSITRSAQDAPQITTALSVEGWVAVSTYPWN